MRILAIFLTMAAVQQGAFSQTTNDPFPDPIVEGDGVITVDFVEFARIPDYDGEPARVMILVYEPGTRQMFVNDMRGRSTRSATTGRRCANTSKSARSSGTSR